MHLYVYAVLMNLRADYGFYPTELKKQEVKNESELRLLR